MDDRIYFADAELPFHVWVREDTGGNGYRWVLREAPAPDAPRVWPAPPVAPRSHDES